MASRRTDAPSATVAIRRQAGIIIIVQLVLAAVILGAAVWATVNLVRIRGERAAAVIEKDEANAAKLDAEKTARELGAAADDYIGKIRDAMQSMSKGQDAALQTDAASRDGAIQALQSAGQRLAALKDSDLAKLLRARPENPVELSDDAGLLALEMERTIARAYKSFGERTQAWHTMTKVTKTGLEPGKSGAHLAPVEDIAADYILRATFACKTGPNDNSFVQDDAAVVADLEAAPDDVRPSLSPETLVRSTALAEACPGVMARLKATAASGEAKGPAPAQDASAFVINELFLHIEKSEDREAARRVREQLRNPGPGQTIYKVLGIEDVDPEPGNRSIRFYYDVQKSQADNQVREDTLQAVRDAIVQVKQDVALTDDQRAKIVATLETWSGPIRAVSLEGKYQRLPPHRAEIWF